MRDKGLAWRNDGGPAEEQMIKEIKGPGITELCDYKAARIEGIWAACYKWHVKHNHLPLLLP